jgi:cyanophycinase
MKRFSYISFGLRLLLVLAPFLIASVSVQATLDSTFLPSGGGYSEIYPGLLSEAIQRTTDNQVNILVLPVGSASNPQSISDLERSEKLRVAEFRRAQIEGACKSAAPDMTCSVTLAPILIRSDAEDPVNLRYFSSDLSAIFILDGDQAVAMQVIGTTPVESAIEQAYQQGILISGTGAGASLQSSAMIAGYNIGYSSANSFEFGAVDVWNASDVHHGLPFGIQNAILDDHFFQLGNPGRLINAISLPNGPHVGVGIDTYTGVQVTDQWMVGNAFGLYSVAIFDEHTYHAAEVVQYRGPHNLLSLRNILVDLIAPGNFFYDLETRTPSLAPPSPHLERSFSNLSIPYTAGTLFLAGDLSSSPFDNSIMTRFIQMSGGNNARLLVIAAGYPTDNSAQRAAESFVATSGVPAQILVIPRLAAPFQLPPQDDYTGIVFIAKDQNLLSAQLDQLDFLKDIWLAGKPLLADDAAAAALGAYFSAHGSTPLDPEEAVAIVQEAFIKGKTNIVRGLNFINANIEPQLLNDNRWGQLFSLAYLHPELIALGLSQNAGVEFTSNGVFVLGDNVVTSLDFSSAILDLGTNQAYVVANGLLDVFTPNEALIPQAADVNESPAPAVTPVVLSSTPTNSPTQTIAPTNTPAPSLTPEPPTETLEPGKATKSPKPTQTPLTIPPSSEPGKMNMMVGFVFLGMVVVMLGILINRKHVDG